MIYLALSLWASRIDRELDRQQKKLESEQKSNIKFGQSRYQQRLKKALDEMEQWPKKPNSNDGGSS